MNSLHYNAFISYKHAPADIAVAKDIQHRLEHFRVPKAIRQKTGKNKIERLFRDQEELPITSDIKGDISYALKDAEFLIVICSHMTRQSTWVTREIREFLKWHDRNHILTVLVDGEPGDVIPEILLEEEKEPLSCDYRAGIRKAHKTEIPRLAAALLGCSYDELVMRARQYRLRRLAVFSSIAAVLAAIAIAYLIWSNRQIRFNYLRAEENYERAEENHRIAEENYRVAEANHQEAEQNYALAEANYQEAMANLEQARRRQSVYLSNEALKALNTEERVLAVQLAMAAFPTPERPYWPHTAVAERALSQAVGAYTSDSLGMQNYSALRNLKLRGAISDFFIDRSTNTVYAYDEYGDVSAWALYRKADSSDTGRLFRRETGSDILSMGPGPENLLLLETGEGLLAVDRRNGETKWEFSHKETKWAFSHGEARWFSPDEYGVERLSLHGQRYVISEDAVFVVAVWNYMPTVSDTLADVKGGITEESGERAPYLVTVGRIDPQTGRLIWESEPLGVSVYPFLSGSNDAAAVSGDSLWFSLRSREGNSRDEARIYRCDLAGGVIEEILTDAAFQTVAAMLPLADGKIAVCGTVSGSSYLQMDFGHILAPVEIALVCLDDRTGEILWRNGFSSSALNYLRKKYALKSLDPAGPDGQAKHLLACIYADEIFVFDRLNGSLVRQSRFDAAVAGLAWFRDDSGCFAMLQNGNIGDFELGDDALTSQITFKKNISGAEYYIPEGAFQPGYVVKSSDSSMLQVFGFLYDEESFFPEGASSYDFSPKQALSCGKFTVIPGETGGEPVLDIYDRREMQLIHSIKPAALLPDPKTDLKDVRLLGSDPEGKQLYACAEGYPEYTDRTLLVLDPETGELIKTHGLRELTPLKSGGSIFYVGSGGNRLVWAFRQQGSNSGGGAEADVPVLCAASAVMDELGELKDLTVSQIPVPEELRKAKYYSGILTDDGNCLVITGRSGILSGSAQEECFPPLLYRVASSEWKMPEAASLKEILAADHSEELGLTALSDGEEIEVWSTDGSLKYRIRDEEAGTKALHFYHSDLLVIWSDHRAARYRASDGNLLSSNTFAYYAGDIPSSGAEWFFSQDHILVKTGDILNLMDPEEWGCVAFVQHTFGYDHENRRILCWHIMDRDSQGKRPYTVRCFTEYSPEDLVRKGTEFLKGEALSERDLAYYGIQEAADTETGGRE